MIKIISKYTMLASSTLLLSIQAANSLADPYLTQPGTKARGMGTAFTAVADDVSAVWYNPAGMSKQKSSFVVEVSQAPTVETESFGRVLNTQQGPEFFAASEITDYSVDDQKLFVAGVYTTDSAGAVGFYYYEPYTLKLSTARFDPDAGSLIVGELDEEISILGATWSYAWGAFSIGAGVEYVMVDDNSSISEQLYDGQAQFLSTNELDVDEDGSDGFAASLGAMWTIHEPSSYDVASFDGWKYNLGAVYRTSSNTDALEYETSTGTSNEFVFKKPTSWDIGFAAETEFNISDSLSVLTLSVQYGEVDYENASDLFPAVYEKWAFGANWAIKFADSFIDQLDVRAGYYDETVSEGNSDFSQSLNAGFFPATKGYTAGIGARKGNWVLDFTAEKRELESTQTIVGSLNSQYAAFGDVGTIPGNAKTSGFDEVFVSGSLRYLFD
jgi:long-chain fatty acid transport protein